MLISFVSGPLQADAIRPAVRLPDGETVLQDARSRLYGLVEQLRRIDVAQGGGFTALADIAFLYAATQHWFYAERDYKVQPPEMHRNLETIGKCISSGQRTAA